MSPKHEKVKGIARAWMFGGIISLDQRGHIAFPVHLFMLGAIVRAGNLERNNSAGGKQYVLESHLKRVPTMFNKGQTYRNTSHKSTTC